MIMYSIKWQPKFLKVTKNIITAPTTFPLVLKVVIARNINLGQLHSLIGHVTRDPTHTHTCACTYTHTHTHVLSCPAHFHRVRDCKVPNTVLKPLMLILHRFLLQGIDFKFPIGTYTQLASVPALSCRSR